MTWSIFSNLMDYFSVSPSSSSTLDEEFTNYCAYFGKSYPNSEEYKNRKKNFEKSLKEIIDFYDESNADYEDVGDVKLGINPFSDWSE